LYLAVIPPLSKGAGGFDLCFCCYGQYVYEPAVISAFSEFHYAIDHCEYRMVFAQHHATTRVVCCTSLANDDVATLCGLAAIYLDTETFAVRVPAVLYLTFTFFVCHWLCSPYFDETKLSYAFDVYLSE
jgi:hypothetical protein